MASPISINPVRMTINRGEGRNGIISRKNFGATIWAIPAMMKNTANRYNRKPSQVSVKGVISTQ